MCAAPGSWATALPRSWPRPAPRLALRAGGCPRRGGPSADRRATSSAPWRRRASLKSERHEQLGRIVGCDVARGRRALRRARRRGRLRGRAGQDGSSSRRSPQSAPESAVLASNTSSISITRLAAALPQARRGQLRGHALLLARAGHAAHRADPRRGDGRRDRGIRARPSRQSSDKQVIVSRGPARASSSTGS